MKSKKAFRSYPFLPWLDEFTQVRKRRNNLPSRKSVIPSADDGEEELEQKKENADHDRIQTEDSTLAEKLKDPEETEKVEKYPAKNNRKRKLLQGATKESYLETKGFVLSKNNKNKQRKKKKYLQKNSSQHFNVGSTLF